MNRLIMDADEPSLKTMISIESAVASIFAPLFALFSFLDQNGASGAVDRVQIVAHVRSGLGLIIQMKVSYLRLDKSFMIV